VQLVGNQYIPIAVVTRSYHRNTGRFSFLTDQLTNTETGYEESEVISSLYFCMEPKIASTLCENKAVDHGNRSIKKKSATFPLLCNTKKHYKFTFRHLQTTLYFKIKDFL
jgi:hypothetical protein